ncbi:hypothetical protein C8R43DRAFT_1208927, partial [Mycena crocata]
TPYFSNNDPLPEPEIPVIRQIIADNEIQLGILEAQISSVAAALDQLRKRRDELAEVTHQYRGAISAVRRVPSELICEIFALTMLDVLHTDVNSVRKKPNQSPWPSAQICAPWRQAAIGYPILWRFIEISKPSPLSYFRLETQLL